MPEIDENNQAQLEWARRRLEALDTIEAKLKEMRALVVYASTCTLGSTEAAKIQEWVDILKAEVQTLDHATADGQPLFTSFSDILPSDDQLQ